MPEEKLEESFNRKLIINLRENCIDDFLFPIDYREYSNF